MCPSVIAGNHDLTLHRGWYENNFDRWHRLGQEVVLCFIVKRQHAYLESQDYDSIIKLLRGEEAVQAGIVYLEDAKYEFKARDNGRTWSVWGSPWQPEFWDWAFNYKRGVEADSVFILSVYHSYATGFSHDTICRSCQKYP